MNAVPLSSLPDFEPVEGYRAKMIHTNSVTIAHWTIDRGHELPTHSHPQEQIVNMMEGEFELTVDGRPMHLKPGDTVVIPGDVPHSGKSLTDCKIIDVWQPRREDYVQAQQSQ